MNEQIKRQLQERIELFAAEITAILQHAVVDSVARAFAGQPGTRALPPAKKGAKAAPVRGLDPETLLKEVKRQGDRRIEQIAKSLRVPSKSLKAPMKKLLADKKVKTTGQARGTKYRAA